MRDGLLLAYAGVTNDLWDIPGGRRLQRFSGTAQPVALSPDGKSLATATHQNTIRLWDIASGRELLLPDRPRGEVQALALAPDGRTWVTGGYDTVLRVWDTASGKESRQLSALGWVLQLALAPDGGQVISLDHHAQSLCWDRKTGREIRKVKFAPDYSGRGLALSADARLAAWATKEGITQLVDLATEREVALLATPEPDPGRAFFFDALVKWPAAFSPDGRRFAASDGPFADTIRLWDIATRRLRCKVTLPKQNFQALAFSPDSRLLATARLPDGIVQLWEVATGKECLLFASPEKQVSSLAFSVDGRTLATGSHEGTLRFWDVASGKSIDQRPGHRGAITAIHYAPDGKVLATASADTTALLWDAAVPSPPPLHVLGDAEGWWHDLAGEDAAKAYRALWALAQTPAQALPLLRARLRPAEGVAADKLRRWIGDLDSERFPVRETAVQELRRAGGRAEPILREVLRGPIALEVRRRIEKLLEELAGEIEAKNLPVLRGLQALELMNTAEARALLDTLARGAPGAWETRAAQESLDRLAKRGTEPLLHTDDHR